MLTVLVGVLFGFPLHLPATIVLFWLSIGLTITVGGIEPVSFNENLGQKNVVKKEKEEKGRKNNQANVTNRDKEIKINETNIFRFKPLLYSGIIFFTIFLCVTRYVPLLLEFIGIMVIKKLKKEILKEISRIMKKH